MARPNRYIRHMLCGHGAILALAVLGPILSADQVVSVAPTAGRSAHDQGSGPVLSASDSVFAAIQRTLASASKERAIRIVHVGDSHSEQGGFAAELATRWSRGAPVAPAFVTPYSRGLGLVRIRLSAGWQRSTWLRSQPTSIEGPSGSSAVTSRATASMRLTLPADLPDGSRMTLWWSGPAGASFRLRVGGVDRTIRRGSPQRTDAPLQATTVPLPSGVKEIVLDGIRLPRRTRLRIGGFQFERPDAHLEYDLLGLRSTTQRHPVTHGAGTLGQYLGSRRHDLIILWYGTNSVRTAPFNSVRFRQDLAELIQLVRRASPQGSLIVVGPPDLAELPPALRPSTQTRATRRRSRPRPPPPIACPEDSIAPSTRDRPTAVARRSHPNVVNVRDLMRQVALTNGAAFFDPYAVQGEAGGMVRWYCATPRLSSGDLIHLTDAGYRQLASSLAEALARRPAP